MNKFADLCGGRYFVIPNNQRGFSWGNRQVDDVFNDLTLAGTNAHYMGPVIVSRTTTPDFQDDDLNTTAEFTLEDGQQRLTTFFIIANEIRKRLEHLSGGPGIESIELERLLFYNKGGRRLRLQNKNVELEQILSNVLIGTPAMPATETPPMVSLRAVAEHVRCFFVDKPQADLLVWKRRIINQAKFIWVDLAAEGVNRYLAFDAINSRGLPLSEFDKIKNFCILIDSIRGIHMQTEEEWYKAIAKLQSFGVSSRNEEAAFVTDLYAVFFNERVSQDAVHASFVERYRELLTRSNRMLEENLREFVSLWEDYAESFGFIATNNRSPYYGMECTTIAGTWLDRLDNMNLATITRILLTSCHRTMSQADFEVVARACEIYTFRVHAIMGFRKDKNGTGVTKLAHEVLRDLKSATYVTQHFCHWLQEWAPLDAVIKKLGNGEPKYYYDRRIKGWAHCYYFLYEYEVGNSPAGVGPLNWATSDTGKINTQEHVLPQQHRDGAWWEHEWPDEAMAERCKHRLGNLTLTSNNSALGRKEIGLKISDPAAPHCYTHANATNSEKLIPTFTDGTTWKSGNILRREYNLLKFASTRWSMPCCSDNVTVDLPLEFRNEDPALAVIQINEANCIVDIAQAEEDNDNGTGEDE